MGEDAYESWRENNHHPHPNATLDRPALDGVGEASSDEDSDEVQ